MRIRGIEVSIAIALCCALIAITLSETAIAGTPTQRALIVPHTHWEGAVFKTREEYLEIGLPNIQKVLYLLKKYPNYRFVLDQMCYVQPFIERYPSEVETFREFLAQGRLQIAGGTHTMHDNNMPSGESTVRQFLLAKSFFRERLGYEVTTGWALDTFGHNAQMPQILKLAGMKSYWFMRGVSSVETPSEFLWQGIDGTRIPAFWLPLTYEPLGHVPGYADEFSRVLRNRFDDLGRSGRYPERVLLAGADVSEANEGLPGLVAQFNQSSTDLLAQLAVPADFEALVAARADRPVIEGEFNPVGHGIYSNRIELKQAMRSMESLLTTAEKLNVIASVVAGKSIPNAIEEAWEPVLFNGEHDPAAGSVVDKVYGEQMQDYSRAKHLAEGSVRRDLDFITQRLNTAGEGIPIVVHNTLGWPRTDVVQVDVPFSDPGVRGFAVVDSEGRAVPIQIIKILRNGDGGIRQARIAFMARVVPSLGYEIFRAVPQAVASEVIAPVGERDFFSSKMNSYYRDSGSIENEFYRVAFDFRTGAMTSLILKENNWEVLQEPGNVVAREYDGGDPWELYGTLSGGIVKSKKAMLPPRAAYTQWSSDFGGMGLTTSGPVFSEFHTMALNASTTLRPFAKNRFGTRVRIYSGLRRIDITTKLVNREESVRYRVVFPTTISKHKGTAVHEIPFGAIERTQQQEFPAQNWIDYADGRKGLALINRGIPGNNVAEGTLLLSLMRGSNLAEYPFVGGNEPGVGSDTGLGVGRDYTFEYALIPHTGDWRSSSLWRAGMEFNNPLIAHTAARHSGALPTKWGLLDISAENVVVSALKPGRQGLTVLRVYEAAGKATPSVRVFFRAQVNQVHEANLIEDSGAEVTTDGDGFRFDLRPFEIKTFTMKLGGVVPAADRGRTN